MAEDYRPRRALDPWPEEPDDPAGTAPADTGPSDPDIGPIVFSGLTKRFGTVHAVEDLSFTAAPGRVTGFLGPNGAGKTTTLRMLVGLIRPTAGSATFGGRHYRDLPQPQETVGVAIDANFHPGRSGRDHLRVMAPTAGVDDARVDEVLDLVELTGAARRKAGGYSLGMRQRLALATALLGDPDYLILDEPANGLDPEGIRWLRSFLSGFADQGRVVLVSSHMLGEVHQTADDVAVIGRGRLLRHAPINELDVAAPACHLVVSDPAAAVQALTAAGVSVGAMPTPDQPGLVRVESQDLEFVGRTVFAAGLAVFGLVKEQASLEETFFRMLDQDAAGAAAHDVDRGAGA